MTTPRFAAVEHVVGWLCAVQSQEYALAKWSIAQRMKRASDDVVERAIAEGRILRTHVLRPTWHFVQPADIRWMLELTSPRVRRMMASYDRRLGLDETVYATSRALIVRALQGGVHLTRAEIAAVLDRGGLSARGQTLAHLVMREELDGVVCSGAPKGRHQTYALLEERAPSARRLTPDEALAELTLRYFTGHGPATLKDYRWWSSLPAAQAREGLHLVRSRLESMNVAGRTYYFARPTRAAPARGAHLLQGYDELIVGYTESRDVLDVAGLRTTFPRNPMPFTHAILIDGQLAGHWRTRSTGDSVAIEVQLAPSATHDAVEAAASRLAWYMGRPVGARFL